MPGRTPYEAFQAFVEPLQDALACLARAKLCTGPGGKNQSDVTHKLVLSGSPVKLRGPAPEMMFRMAMRYAIVKDERGDPWRVTTRAYDYEVTRADGAAILSYHWHPSGRSHVQTPHLHLGSTQLQPDAVLSSKDHLTTGRITLEQVVRTVIDMGAEPLVDDWERRLADSEDVHKLFRSWT